MIKSSITMIIIALVSIGLALFGAAETLAGEGGPFLAGAATADISPRTLPALQNGGFLGERQ
jgi:hypothetical protein